MTNLTNPALTDQSDSYPKAWGGKVPLRVRMLQTVRPDILLYRQDLSMFCKYGEEYEVITNRNGAVSAIVSGSLLGLRPHEFEIIEWYPERNTP